MLPAGLHTGKRVWASRLGRAAVSAAPASREAIALRERKKRWLPEVVGVFSFGAPQFLARPPFPLPFAMPIEHRVSAAVVNFQTPDLLETAVRSFHATYPTVKLLVIDNGSSDRSPEIIRALRSELGSTIEARLLEENRYHGPAMDLAMRELDTPLVYVFDSDTETLRGGFLEEMADLADPDDVYGVGRITSVNRRGFATKSGVPVLVSAYMLIKRRLYLDLPPFTHHGLPVLSNFTAAAERGHRLESYPIDEFVKHLGRGTAERYGYGLGIRSRLDYLLNKLGW